MVPAGLIERGAAVWAARIAVEVRGNGQQRAIDAAENGRLVPFGLRPGGQRMIGESVVAVLACIKKATTMHFDGDDVCLLVIVSATCLRVESNAMDDW